jgi:type I restriction enzyme S subunit
MFGDPVTNPKGWPVWPLLDIVGSKLQNGAYYTQDLYSKNGVEMVHMGDAFYDVIKRGCLKRVLAPTQDLEKYKLTTTDVLISRRSLTYEGAAKPSLIPESKESLIFESSMIRVTPDQTKVRTRYLFQYLADSAVKAHFVRKYVTGATIKGISQKNLEKVMVMVPPVSVQDDFINKINMFDTACGRQAVQVSELSTLFRSISQRAFRGEL